MTAAQQARALGNLDRLMRKLECWYAANEYDYGEDEPYEVGAWRRKIGWIRDRLRVHGALPWGR